MLMFSVMRSLFAETLFNISRAHVRMEDITCSAQFAFSFFKEIAHFHALC